MAFSGMRIGEVLQLTKPDIRKDGKISYFSVNEEEEGKSVKSGVTRNVPIHSALIQEGLLEYVEKLPEGGPLFPDKKPDKFGNRGGDAWKVTGRFIRDKVGITDKRKVPNHAWRHRMEDELRAAEVPEAERDAIVGHTRQTTGAGYGIRGEPLRRLSRYLERVKVPKGVKQAT